MTYRIHNGLIAQHVPRSGKDEFRFHMVDQAGKSSLHGSVFLEDSVIDFAWGKAPSSKKKRELNGTAKNLIADDSVIAILSSGDVVSISAQSRVVVRHEVKTKLSKIISIEDNTIWGLSKGSFYKVELDAKSTKVKVPEFVSIVIKSGVTYIGTSSGLFIGRIYKNTFEKEKEIKTGFEVSSIEVQDSVVVASSTSQAVLVDGEASVKELITGENEVKIQVAGEIFIISSESLKVFTPTGDYVKNVSTSHPIDYVFTMDGSNYVSWHSGADIHVQQITDDTDSIALQNGTTAKPKSSTLIHVEDAVQELDLKSVEGRLHDILGQDDVNAADVTELCSALHNDDDVKQIVSDLPQEQVERLFKALNTSTPVWLKWLLLMHGNSIAKSSFPVKNLQQELRSNIGTIHVDR
ncbi:UTP9 [Candida theae]|uniref:UTP9 n=1 Tax=Candida theae TaxID=1198502 RepID=A0AAD5BJQ9_9ASCO|nr:UTP9 [Candida theae]KAI5968933.1 UTP9 [Candida theae]